MILDKEEKKVLRNYIVIKAMLGECEGGDPSFLKPGQTLWEWFGIETEEQCRTNLFQLRQVIKKYPHIENKLNQKEWFIEWKDDKYFLSYKKSLLRKKVDSFSDTLIHIAGDKEVRIFGTGFLVGATVLCLIYAPFLFHKIFIFILCFCFYGFIAAAVFPVFLHGHFKKYLDKRYHDILLIALFILAVAIAISISLLMVGEIGKNPVNPEFDREQSYPY